VSESKNQLGSFVLFGIGISCQHLLLVFYVGLTNAGGVV
jgi:hypothetical protein